MSAAAAAFLIRRGGGILFFLAPRRFPGSLYEGRRNTRRLCHFNNSPSLLSFLLSPFSILLLLLLLGGWRKRRMRRISISVYRIESKWIEIASWWRRVWESRYTVSLVLYGECGSISHSETIFFFSLLLSCVFFFLSTGRERKKERKKKPPHPSPIGRIQSGSDGSVTL